MSVCRTLIVRADYVYKISAVPPELDVVIIQVVMFPAHGYYVPFFSVVFRKGGAWQEVCRVDGRTTAKATIGRQVSFYLIHLPIAPGLGFADFFHFNNRHKPLKTPSG